MKILKTNNKVKILLSLLIKITNKIMKRKINFDYLLYLIKNKTHNNKINYLNH